MIWLKIFNQRNKDIDEVEELKERYRTGNVGDVEVKKKLAKAIDKVLEPFIEKRKEFESRPDDVKEILHEGTKRANKIAKENMNEIVEKMGLYIP